MTCRPIAENMVSLKMFDGRLHSVYLMILASGTFEMWLTHCLLIRL